MGNFIFSVLRFFCIDKIILLFLRSLLRFFGSAQAQTYRDYIYDAGEQVIFVFGLLNDPDDREEEYGEELVKWYRLGAEQGCASAQNDLGNYYITPVGGVSRDEKEAMKWLHQAAKQGLAEAQYNLGNGYYGGWAVPQDYKQAAWWWRLAAEQGLGIAQYAIGIAYARGEGVPENDVLAYMWLTIRKQTSSYPPPEEIDEVAERMTPSQIAEAEEMAQKWIASNENK